MAAPCYRTAAGYGTATQAPPRLCPTCDMRICEAEILVTVPDAWVSLVNTKPAIGDGRRRLILLAITSIELSKGIHVNKIRITLTLAAMAAFVAVLLSASFGSVRPSAAQAICSGVGWEGCSMQQM
jgi:hypothetical protein